VDRGRGKGRGKGDKSNCFGSYDLNGNVISTTTPAVTVGSTTVTPATQTVYDGLNRPIETIFPAVSVGAGLQTATPTTFTSYDKLGNVSSTTDQLGRTTQFLYTI
jgi:YD repeat-containing protein